VPHFNLDVEFRAGLLGLQYFRVYRESIDLTVFRNVISLQASVHLTVTFHSVFSQYLAAFTSQGIILMQENNLISQHENQILMSSDINSI
jgi:hypothetical protein